MPSSEPSKCRKETARRRSNRKNRSIGFKLEASAARAAAASEKDRTRRQTYLESRTVNSAIWKLVIQTVFNDVFVRLVVFYSDALRRARRLQALSDRCSTA